MRYAVATRPGSWILAVAGLTVLLVAVGFTILRAGGDGTAADGANLVDEPTRIVAGPSGPGSESTPDDSGLRSAGPIERNRIERNPSTGSDGPAAPDSAERTTTTSAPDRATSTVEARTTTTAKSTGPDETRPPRKTSATGPPSSRPTEPPVSKPDPPSTRPTVTLPPVTRPTVTLPPVTEPGPTLGTLPVPDPKHSITPADLAAARKRWRSTGYDSYSMVVARACFCPRGTAGPFQVVVRNGEVQSADPIDGPDGGAGLVDRRSLTVPGLFDLIDGAFEADRLHVAFDRSTGVPLSIEIDHVHLAVDDELTVTVRDFRPLRDG